MMTTTTNLSPVPRRLSLLERWLRLERRRDAALAEQRLGALDDNLLRDIGIDRADIPRAVRGR
jgi:uncharacterized protein YjiS (DUF1127 family)